MELMLVKVLATVVERPTLALAIINARAPVGRR
ncbi:MAG: hypothetical protein ACJAT2_001475 [Bacteriovoracaceae bacterium]|jgi:hypothetical protein